MTVISTTKDPENLTLTLVAEFNATPEQVWTVWEDPRTLERWWGPPSWPATFTRHDFVVGGESRYHMTGPDGDTSSGYWQIQALDKPNRLDFTNGLAGPDGEPTPGMPPMSGHVTFEAIGTRTKMTVVSRFVDFAQMEMMLGMGMAEGMTEAIGQIDGIVVTASVRANDDTTGGKRQPMPRVSTYLNFMGNTEEAFNFYKSVFGTEFLAPISRMSDMPPSPGQPALSEAEKGMVMHVELPILAGHVIMGTDMLESLGHKRRLGNSMTINLELEERAEAERLFKLLSEDGSDQFGLMEVPWGAYWGTCADRYGIRWMFNCPTSPAG
ncbi:MAG: SRPBCC domain-containing protein [Acidimicrobiales bacterium]